MIHIKTTSIEENIFSSWVYLTKHGTKHMVDMEWLKSGATDASEFLILEAVDNILHNSSYYHVSEDDLDDDLLQRLNYYRNSKIEGGNK